MEQIYGVSYEELKKDPKIPKSRGELIRSLINSAVKAFSANTKKYLITLLIIIAAVFLLNLLKVSSDRFLYARNSTGFLVQLDNFLFSANDISTDHQGFSYKRTNNYREIFGLDLMLVLFVFSIVGRVKDIGSKAFSEPGNFGKVHKQALRYTDKSEKGFQLKGFALALLFSFVLKNPVAVFFMALLLLFDVSRGNEGSLFRTVFLWRISGNVKKKAPADVVDAEVILELYWLTVGAIVCVPLTLILWLALDYALWSRIVLLLGLSLVCFYFGYIKKDKKIGTAANLLGLLLISLTLWYLLGQTAEARGRDQQLLDKLNGKRRKSAKELKDFVWEGQQAAKPSWFRQTWTALHTAVARSWSSIKDHFTHGAAPAVEGFHAVYQAKDEGNLAMGVAAYNSAMSSMPGMEQFSQAAVDIDAAMNGHQGGPKK